MNSEHFQEAIALQIKKVTNYRSMSFDTKLMVNALALSGEAGEIANKIKKEVWSGGGLSSFADFRADLGEELGDVLYHVAELATLFDFHLDDLMTECVQKTIRRNGELNADG